MTEIKEGNYIHADDLKMAFRSLNELGFFWRLFFGFILTFFPKTLVKKMNEAIDDKIKKTDIFGAKDDKTT